MANCKFCGKEIHWTKEGRKNVPVETDGATHKCEEMMQARNSLRAMAPSEISAEEIARYEAAMNEAAATKKK